MNTHIQVQKGGETILVRAAEDKSIVATADEKATKKTTIDNQIRKSESNGSSKNKASSLNKSLKRYILTYIYRII